MPARSPAARLVAPVFLAVPTFLALSVAMPACQGSPTRPAPASCAYVVVASTSTFEANGGTASLGVSTTAGCPWTASAQVPWIVIASGGSGTGPGSVTFRVEPNAQTADRTGVITVASESMAVRQSGVACRYDVAPASASFSSEGGAGTVAVSAPEDCNWTAASAVSWVDLLSGREGRGPGRVDYRVLAHSGTSQRIATLEVAGHEVAIVQAAPTPCDPRIAPTRASFGAAGGTGGFDVTAPRGCSWSARSEASWVEVTAPRHGESDGDDRVAFVVAANPLSGGRSGTIRVGEARFTIDQSGLADCEYSVAPTEIALGFGGMGEGRIEVQTGTGCPWTAACDVPWIALLDPSEREGPAVMRYRVEPYTGADTRREAIRFRWPTATEGQNVWITQTGCLYTLSPALLNVPAAGGQHTVQVYSSPVNQNTMRECSWRVTAEVPWLRATPALGYGFDRVTVVVDANPSASPRQGTVLVERVRLTVWQAGS